jgi:hypothetical protein
LITLSSLSFMTQITQIKMRKRISCAPAQTDDAGWRIKRRGAAPPSLIDSNGYSSGANDFLSARKTFPIISMALGGGVRCGARRRCRNVFHHLTKVLFNNDPRLSATFFARRSLMDVWQ